MTRHQHIDYQTGGIKPPSSSAARRRKVFNKVMKIVMTFFALAVVGCITTKPINSFNEQKFKHLRLIQLFIAE